MRAGCWGGSVKNRVESSSVSGLTLSKFAPASRSALRGLREYSLLLEVVNARISRERCPYCRKTQRPSPAPDLIRAKTKNQPRTHIGIETNRGTSPASRKCAGRMQTLWKASLNGHHTSPDSGAIRKLSASPLANRKQRGRTRSDELNIHRPSEEVCSSLGS